MAQTTWTGGNGNTNWSDNGNWTSSAPTSADAATLDGSGATQPTLTATSTANTLSMSGNILTMNGQTLNVDSLYQSGGTITGTGTINLGSATLNGGSIASTVGINITGTLNLNNAVSLGSSIGGAGGVVVSGSIALSGTNTYSGGTNVNTGSITVGSNSALGTEWLSLGGGTTLRSGAAVTLTNNIFLIGSATIDTNGNDTRLSGSIVGSRGLTKAGAGTLTLTGTNSYDGTTTISSGTLQIGNEGITGTLGAGAVVNNGTLVFKRSDRMTVANAISGSGTVVQDYNGTTSLTGSNSYGETIINIGTLQIGDGGTSGTLGTGAVTANSILSFNRSDTLTVANAIGGSGWLTQAGSGTTILTGSNTYGNTTTISAGTLQIGDGGTSGTLGIGSVTNDSVLAFNRSNAMTVANAISGGGSVRQIGSGTTILTGNNTYGGTTTISAGTLQIGDGGTTGNLGGGNVANSGTLAFNRSDPVTVGNAIGGTGSVIQAGTGRLILTGANTYTGGTTVSGGILQGTTTSLQGNIVNNAAVTFDQGGSGTYAGNMSGTGFLTVQGGGALTLAGANSYTGGTSLLAGTLIGNSASLQGNILNNGSVTFNQTGSGSYGGNMSGPGGMTLQGGGTLAMTGTNTYTGGTTVNASTLIVNGSVAGNVTLVNNGVLGGAGSIGTLVSNGGMLAPGNSIGTLNINGNFTQNGGTYVVEANAQGQSDRVNVGGTATINGATVQVVAAPGNYGTSTTYTILNATGGVSGTYASVSSNFAFLTPALSYNANNVFLTLALQGSTPFSGFGGNTVNQRSVGSALDQTYANASGDFATVINALAGLSTTQASPALDAISGQQYADFGTTNVNTGAMFMNTLGQQMAMARGGSAPGSRIALAQACEVEACDGSRPLSAWFSGMGGLGSVQGDGNSSTLTYNFGGAAAGVDYRLDPSILVGLGVGYSHGTQWTRSFMGQGWTDGISVAAYGSFTPKGQGAGFYADALAGYAYFNNQMQRQIQIPGLQPRTASGSTGANQFLTQLETGYKLGLWEQAAMTVTPFGRLQFSTTTQNAFTESGAQSLSLNVAQQTTNSLRTMLGAELGSSIGLADQRQLDLVLRLGWQHEYADIARPITAAFSGAPTASFTVYGATPTRDAAIIGFSAGTRIAEATQLYVRYDGQVGGGTDNHAFNLGVRFSW